MSPDTEKHSAMMAGLITSLEQSAAAAAQLAESVGEPMSLSLNELSVGLFNGATELREAFQLANGEGLVQEASSGSVSPEHFATRALGEVEAWGVFDKDDLEHPEPMPFATFESEVEARGYLLLAVSGVITPAIRLCKVRGTVSVDVAPNAPAQLVLP